jgi:hypothetical protein
MQIDLHRFLSQLLGVVAMTLLPVVLTAFVSMPLSLNRHPGEPVQQPLSLPRHMT